MFAVDSSFHRQPHFVKYAVRNAKYLKGVFLRTFQEALHILREPASFTDMGMSENGAWPQHGILGRNMMINQ